MGKRKNPPYYIDNFAAVSLRIYAERWEQADKEIRRIRHEIFQRTWKLEIELGKHQSEQRRAERAILKLVKANVPEFPPESTADNAAEIKAD